MSKRNMSTNKTQYENINLLFKQQFSQSLNRSFVVSRERDHITKKANFKAELVRNELINRSDLMRMYQPPIRKSQLPTNNPFYTKTIINGQTEDERMPEISMSGSLKDKGN